LEIQKKNAFFAHMKKVFQQENQIKKMNLYCDVKQKKPAPISRILEEFSKMAINNRNIHITQQHAYRNK
jgi:hypothetical protein